MARVPKASDQFDPNGQLVRCRIADLLQDQAVWGHDLYHGVVSGRAQHGGWPVGGTAAFTHGHERAHQCPDHVMAEGIGPHRADDEIISALPPQLAQIPNR